MTRTVSRPTQMIRDALIVALRAQGQPMSSGELVKHMPWIRRDQPSPHPNHWRCDGLPEDEPRPGLCVRVLRCTGAIHTVDRRPQSFELHAHLKALARNGLVRSAAGTVPGRHNLWELTDAGLANGEIEQLRSIIDLDHMSVDWRSELVVDVVDAAPARAQVSAAESSVIDWQRVVDGLGRFDDTEFAADRSHLLTADTYRYVIATAPGGTATAARQLELTGGVDSGYAAMTLHGGRRVAIAVADLRSETSRMAAAAKIMEALYRTSRFDAEERVLILIAGLAARSQIETHLGVFSAACRMPFVLQFDRAALAGLAFDGFPHFGPDLTLTRLARRDSVAHHHHILALSVGLREDFTAPGGAP